MKKYYVYDIELEFSTRPNDDIYTEFYEKEKNIIVPDWVQDVKEYLTQIIIENLEVEFDTPDEPYYETSDATFEYELVDDESYDDDPTVDDYIKLQKESKYENN
jgi:hypothetical protein